MTAEQQAVNECLTRLKALFGLPGGLSSVDQGNLTGAGNTLAGLLSSASSLLSVSLEFPPVVVPLPNLTKVAQALAALAAYGALAREALELVADIQRVVNSAQKTYAQTLAGSLPYSPPTPAEIEQQAMQALVAQVTALRNQLLQQLVGLCGEL